MHSIKGILNYQSVVSRSQIAPRPGFRGNYLHGCQLVASINKIIPSVVHYRKLLNYFNRLMAHPTEFESVTSAFANPAIGEDYKRNAVFPSAKLFGVEIDNWAMPKPVDNMPRSIACDIRRKFDKLAYGVQDCGRCVAPQHSKQGSSLHIHVIISQ